MNDPAPRHARARTGPGPGVTLGTVAVVVAVAVAAVGSWALAHDDGDTSRTAGGPATTIEAVTATTPQTLPPTTATTAPPRDPVRGNGQPVTLAFAGDTHFEGALRSKLLADPATVLAPVAPVLSSADVAVVNLETAVTERGVKQPKAFNFRAPASALDALRAAGIDAASVANNHGIDYGPDGLADTLAARRAKSFPLIGVGADAGEAYAPWTTEVRGQRIAVFAASDVIDAAFLGTWPATDTRPGLATATDLDRLTGAVRAWRAKADTVVVFLHWGSERVGCPTGRQQEVARALTEAGADIVVGAHAHVLEGAGRMGGAFVAYGLGNFVFYNEKGENGRSGVLVVTATGRTVDSYRWVPARIRGGVATPLPPGPGADAEVAHWHDLRACTGLTA